ncbi:MAG: FAD-binding oxidoreductase [Acidobacteria bacterium]|nr:FAD-binding oxidoreductase [Acidobacteriota bacterium]
MPVIQLDQLRATVRGAVLQPGDDAYEAARPVYNAMIDKRPALIVRAVDVADVIATVDYARTNRLLLAIRGGGHNGGGLGTCDGGVVLDLSAMRGVHVEPASRTVRVAAGCVWGDVDHATHPFGLAVPSGFISTTGVSGLTLGGGTGYLTRQYGLTIDNLLSVDVVLADGSVVTTDAANHSDLFWAMRGGGGNFGVATSFVFLAHPVRTMYAGPTFWPLAQTVEVMRAYRDFILRAPEYVNGFFAFLTVPPVPMFPEHLHLQKVCGVVWTCTGPAAQAEEATRPMRSVGKPLLDHQAEMPYPAVNSLFDGLYPAGLQWYWRADFVNQLSDEAIERHARHGATLPTMHSTMHLYPVDGAAHRVGRADTAFSYRDANWSQVIVGVDPDPARSGQITAWCKDYFDAVHPYSAGGAYVNFMMEEGRERVQASFRENYDRLAVIKQNYDPENLFRVNQNIRPATTAP